ncbi:hypothetical protein Efla_002016 [Eimeria flavescens]
MNRRRPTRSRRSEAQQNFALPESAKNEQPAGTACPSVNSEEPVQPTSTAQASSGKFSSPGYEHAVRGTDGEQHEAAASLPGLANVDTSELAAAAAKLAPQEDSCAFHSPRSYPGDLVEEKGSPNSGLDEEPSEPPASPPHQLQQQPVDSFQGDKVNAADVPRQGQPLLSGEEGKTPGGQSPPHAPPQQEGQQAHQGQLPQFDVDMACGVPSMGASGMSEGETEGIRTEESCKKKAQPESPAGITATSAHVPDTDQPPPASATACSEAVLPQRASFFPVCIGSAVQADEATVTDGTVVGFVEEAALSKAGDREWGREPPGSPCPPSTQPSELATPRGLLSRLSDYATFLTRTVAKCRFNEQQRQQQASTAGEVGALAPHPATSGADRSRFWEEVAEWHRSLLDLYGGPCEEIMRLALQGLFDVFCLYRAHFLAPLEGLLHAEALHERWRLRAEHSLGRVGVGTLHCIGSATSSSSAASEHEGRGQGDGVEGLPLSVRLALYGAVSLALKVVRALQLLLEVNKLRQGGEGQRFALCMRLELLKLVLKMMLYALTPFAFYCDEQSIGQALEIHKGKQIAAEADKLRPCYGRRTGRRIHPLPSALSQAHEQQIPTVSPPPELPRRWALLVALWLLKELKEALSLHRLNDIGKRLASTPWRPLLGEILYHLRPFIHLYLLKRARSVKSWTPWVVALLVEAHSVSLLHGSPHVMERLSPIEAAELRRRLTGLPYALLRPPFFDKFLARPFEAVDYIVRLVPLINHFNVLDVFLVYRNLYFTTSNT